MMKSDIIEEIGYDNEYMMVKRVDKLSDRAIDYLFFSTDKKRIT